MENKLEVFVIDDNEIDCLIAKVIIEKGQSFRATSFGSSKEAMAFLSYLLSSQRWEALPIIIFVDLDMPLVSGWDFLDSYASLTKSLSLPLPAIYIFSSSINPHDYARAKGHPLVKDMLIKPLSYGQVEKVLSTHIPLSAF